MKSNWEWIKLVIINRYHDLPPLPRVPDDVINNVINDLLTAAETDDIFAAIGIISVFGPQTAHTLLKKITGYRSGTEEFTEAEARLAFALAATKPPPMDILVAALDHADPMVKDLAEKALEKVADLHLTWDVPEGFNKHI